MQPFTTLTGIAVALPLINIDTDMIIPKQFLKTIKRTGLGVHLFDEMRYDDKGGEVADFVLNRDPWRQAKILVSGANFGCGSSREHAPWAIADFGIRCIVAPSFADIFYNNCFKNGILPVTLEEDEVTKLTDYAQSAAEPALTVDLTGQSIRTAGGDAFAFEIDPFRKHCLLNGLDDIGMTLEKEEFIRIFEQQDRAERPWFYKAA